MNKKSIITITVLLTTTLLVSSLFTQQKQRTKKQTITAETTQQGPIITKEGVKFVYEGKATKVDIAGTFNNWTKQPLKKEKENLWSVTLKLAPGKYQYKFIIDEKNWITDPKNSHTITTPDGYTNSLLVVYPPTGIAGPQITKEGVKFTFYAPDAKEVYLAGDFNNWADNEQGVVTNKEHLMTKQKDGSWVKTLKLAVGKYKYKFVVDGTWVKDPFGEDAMDEYDNSLIKVYPEGIKSLGPELRQDGEVIFRFYSPDAKKVVLAGDFNNWSTTNDVMTKDEKTGVWSITKKLQKGEYKYKFIVDGEWTKDPFGTDAMDEYDNSIVVVK